MMINTDGKATVANWPLKHGGQDVPTTPPSAEGRSINSLIEERERTAAADKAAVDEARRKERRAFTEAAETLDDDDFAEYLEDMVNGNTEEQA